MHFKIGYILLPVKQLTKADVHAERAHSLIHEGETTILKNILKIQAKKMLYLILLNCVTQINFTYEILC